MQDKSGEGLGAGWVWRRRGAHRRSEVDAPGPLPLLVFVRFLLSVVLGFGRGVERSPERALPTETKGESETSQSKGGTFGNLSKSEKIRCQSMAEIPAALDARLESNGKKKKMRKKKKTKNRRKQSRLPVTSWVLPSTLNPRPTDLSPL